MERTEYLRTYPSFCRKCEGWGILKGFTPQFRISECECLEIRTCPRCGTANSIGESPLVCTHCGWDVDDKQRGLPGSNVI